MNDLISRQAAIDVLGAFTQTDALGHTPKQIVEALPSAQQEEAIPIIWLEKHIEWLQSLDNDFATLTAGIIIGTIAKWRGEQDD